MAYPPGRRKEDGLGGVAADLGRQFVAFLRVIPGPGAVVGEPLDLRGGRRLPLPAPVRSGGIVFIVVVLEGGPAVSDELVVEIGAHHVGRIPDTVLIVIVDLIGGDVVGMGLAGRHELIRLPVIAVLRLRLRLAPAEVVARILGLLGTDVVRRPLQAGCQLDPLFLQGLDGHGAGGRLTAVLALRRDGGRAGFQGFDKAELRCLRFEGNDRRVAAGPLHARIRYVGRRGDRGQFLRLARFERKGRRIQRESRERDRAMDGTDGDALVAEVVVRVGSPVFLYTQGPRGLCAHQRVTHVDAVGSRQDHRPVVFVLLESRGRQEDGVGGVAADLGGHGVSLLRTVPGPGAVVGEPLELRVGRCLPLAAPGLPGHVVGVVAVLEGGQSVSDELVGDGGASLGGLVPDTVGLAVIELVGGDGEATALSGRHELISIPAVRGFRRGFAPGIVFAVVLRGLGADIAFRPLQAGRQFDPVRLRRRCAHRHRTDGFAGLVVLGLAHAGGNGRLAFLHGRDIAVRVHRGDGGICAFESDHPAFGERVAEGHLQPLGLSLSQGEAPLGEAQLGILLPVVVAGAVTQVHGESFRIAGEGGTHREELVVTLAVTQVVGIARGVVADLALAVVIPDPPVGQGRLRVEAYERDVLVLVDRQVLPGLRLQGPGAGRGAGLDRQDLHLLRRVDHGLDGLVGAGLDLALGDGYARSVVRLLRRADAVGQVVRRRRKDKLGAFRDETRLTDAPERLVPGRGRGVRHVHGEDGDLARLEFLAFGDRDLLGDARLGSDGRNREGPSGQVGRCDGKPHAGRARAVGFNPLDAFHDRRLLRIVVVGPGAGDGLVGADLDGVQVADFGRQVGQAELDVGRPVLHRAEGDLLLEGGHRGGLGHQDHGVFLHGSLGGLLDFRHFEGDGVRPGAGGRHAVRAQEIEGIGCGRSHAERRLERRRLPFVCGKDRGLGTVGESVREDPDVRPFTAGPDDGIGVAVRLRE